MAPYWPLEPMEVITIWLAATDSVVENGCMRVLPGTQNQRLLKRSELIDTDGSKDVLSSGMDPKMIDESQAVNLELAAGDVSLHDPRVVHGSNPNHSDKWRKGLTLRYIPTSTLVKRAEHASILVRGKADPAVDNLYAERPKFVEGKHMPFRDAEAYR